MSEDKIQIVKEDVIAMFENGKSRIEIGDYYGLSVQDRKALFASIPELKKKKTRREKAFVLVEKATLQEVEQVATETSGPVDDGASILQAYTEQNSPEVENNIQGTLTPWEN